MALLGILCFWCVLWINVDCKPPNIIFFLADDLGYDDVGFQDNNQTHTPNIDNLKKESQFLEWYYGQNLCSPTRSTIMTGAFPLHTGVNTVFTPNYAAGVPLKFKFLPKILYENGYDTHAVGKWHMGFYKWAYTPTFRGFKSFLGYFNGAEDYYSHKVDGGYDFIEMNSINCGEGCYQPDIDDYEEYSTFVFAKRAIQIIKNHSQSDSNQPLFLYIPWQSVHEPCEVPESYIAPYNKSINDTKRRTFAGMISILDEGIGNITTVLNEHGYMNDDGNTIIIFSSDNGSPVNQCGGYNYPLKGSKATIWEGGQRLTAYIYGTPDLIPKSLRGTNYTQLMHTVDWLPTFLEAADIDINSSINHTIDGVSQWKGIIGEEQNDKYFAFRDYIWYGYSTMNTQWNVNFVNYTNVGYRYQWNKLINGTSPAGGHNKPPNDVHSNLTDNVYAVYPQLYNLQTDPYEYHNITKDNSQLVESLKQKMYELEKNGVPQLDNDTSCFPIINPNSSLGKIWAPWC